MLIITIIIAAVLLILMNSKLKDKSKENAELKKQNDALKIIEEKYSPIINIENEYDKKISELESLLNEISNSEKTIAEYNKQILSIEKILSVYESRLDIIESGIYTPIYDFSTSEEYKTKLSLNIDKQKAMIQSNRAATCYTIFTMDGSATKGQKVVKSYQKIILRAYNNECDALISKVKWNNFNQIKERMLKSREVLNKQGETFSIHITNEYEKLKIEQLTLEHEYNLKKQKEKEQQRAAQEALREEERARKEFERAEQEAIKEELMYQKALEKARKEAEITTGDAQAKLIEKIQKLETELKEAQSRKERAMSMAQQTKKGHVYVISNIGSFGENVYKIGMTRRLEPEERVKELGDASVPFSFDIHAMIFSEDAPKLEAALHNRFESHKVNMVNPRKEFFNVTLDEIKNVVKSNHIDATFIDIPEAEEYRETKAILKKLQSQA
ncbi:MAG: DUF4041 domain-containing protein [Lentimicrobiaceae bacterium]|nr:DUF4041 domain-containing protein [Lentimicrobiaceae bacterium]